MKKLKNRKACHFATPMNNYASKVIRIPFEIIELENNSFHILIKVEVNSIQGDMIVDTGASVSVVDEKIFPQNTENQTDRDTKIQANSISGEINHTRIVKVHSFKSGELDLKEVLFAAINLTYVNDIYSKYLNRQIIGLLGCDFCVRHRVFINYHTKEISLPI